jgi:hypothetical protein
VNPYEDLATFPEDPSLAEDSIRAGLGDTEARRRQAARSAALPSVGVPMASVAPTEWQPDNGPIATDPGDPSQYLDAAPAAGQAGMDDMSQQATTALQASKNAYMAGAGRAQEGASMTSLALQNAEAAAAVRPRAVKVANPLHPVVKHARDETVAGNDAIVQGTRGVLSAEDQLNREILTQAGNHFARMRELSNIEQTAQIEQAERMSAMVKQQEEVLGSISKYAKKMADGPAEDPGQFWASRSAFQKIALILSAAAKGWLQGQGMAVDPMADINEGIRQNIEAQRSNRALLGTRLSAKERQLEAGRAQMQAVMAAAGSEGAGREAIKLAHLQATAAKMEQLMAEYKVEKAPAEAVRLMGSLRKEIAASELKLNVELAKQPAYRTKMVAPKTVPYVGPDGSTYNIDPKEAAKYRAQQMGEAEKQRMAGLDQVGAAALQEVNHDFELGKERLKGIAAAAQGPTDEQIRTQHKIGHSYYQDTNSLKAELKLIKEFKQSYSNGVPGVWGSTLNALKGGGWSTLTEEQRKAYSLMQRVVMVRLRRETGAAIAAGELPREAAATILSTLDDQANEYIANHLAGEEDIFAELDLREREALGRLDEAKRPVLAVPGGKELLGRLEGIAPGDMADPAPVGYGDSSETFEGFEGD